MNFYKGLRKVKGPSIEEKRERIAAHLRALEPAWDRAFAGRQPGWRELLDWIERVEFGIDDSPRTLANRAKRAWRYSTTIPSIAGGRLLDVGCGLGTDAVLLHLTTGVRITGIDMDDMSLGAGAVRIAWFGERLGFDADAVRPPAKMNGANLGFDGGSFDVVWSNESIEHIHPTAALFSEVHRVLKPGGRFFVINQNGFSAYEQLKALHTRGLKVYYKDVDPLSGEAMLIAEERLLTPGGCRRRLERIGFMQTRVMLNGVLPSPLARVLGSADRLERLDRVACTLPILRSQASDFILMATKA